MEWVEPFYTRQHAWLPDYAHTEVNERHRAIVVELAERAARLAQAFASQPRADAMTVLHGGFHEVELEGRFDVVCYWDGIGADGDQRRPLRR